MNRKPAAHAVRNGGPLPSIPGITGITGMPGLSGVLAAPTVLTVLAVALAAPAALAQTRVDRNLSLGSAPDALTPATPRTQQEIIRQLQSQPAVRAPASTADSVPLQTPVQSSAYAVEAVSPTIYSKNVVYPTPYPLPLHFAGRATIGSVSWQYGTQTRPAGFEAALCWNDSKHCVNVTTLGSGSTDAFSGLDAGKPFKLIYQVVGTGALSPPVVGETGQIIVNYRLWE